ncbi:MAG: nucleoside-diphosphate sugar epimerase/dehydratase [Schaedlerella sp.]|nr:nucleoside-diphosphate sugar epimerase/dehydratase [Schaedlerella sp.]
MNKEINYKLMVRRIVLVIFDSLCIVFSGFFALATRFEFIVSEIPPEHMVSLVKYEPYFVGITLIIFVLFRMYSSLWEYAGEDEINNIVMASVVSGLAEYLLVVLTGGLLPRSYYLLRILYLGITIIFTRFAYRMLRKKRHEMFFGNKDIKRTMIVGAGESGKALILEIQNSQYLNQKVCCAIDDDPAKIGKYIKGIYIAGDRNSIKKCVERYQIEQIIVSMPSVPMAQIRPILEICKETECELKILPGMYQIVNDEIKVSKLRHVSIEDLLGREEIQIELDEIMGYVSDKVVMVTGGGGSIGSELCRQIVSYHPKQLIIFDIYENNAYDIQQELKRLIPDLNLVVLIGSIRDYDRLEYVMGKYRPQIIYHAAAHKHVPLMEDSPNEAIKNNVLGTYKLATAADRWGVECFVQISTDKAVNPTNIMGASKRVCEMIIQMYAKSSKTKFVAVRFGNVLGSNGSVIPLFKKQIKEGGPITVTHPEIIRYFMTIPEAVSLVLQAGAYAKGGEIFVLDMGEPVKIRELAENMIRLSGLEVGRDIKIVYTGLRPGEKLYEELLMNEEGMSETKNKLIHIGKPIEMDEYLVKQTIQRMDKETDEIEMRKLVKSIVPTYMLPEEWKEDLKTLA